MTQALRDYTATEAYVVGFDTGKTKSTLKILSFSFTFLTTQQLKTQLTNKQLAQYPHGAVELSLVLGKKKIGSYRLPARFARDLAKNVFKLAQRGLTMQGHLG